MITRRLVDARTLSSATKCKKGFSCLDQSLSVCPVVASVDNELEFMECLHPRSCDYQGESEGRKVCMCPVRHKIYDRYGT